MAWHCPLQVLATATGDVTHQHSRSRLGCTLLFPCAPHPCVVPAGTSRWLCSFLTCSTRSSLEGRTVRHRTHLCTLAAPHHSAWTCGSWGGREPWSSCHTSDSRVGGYQGGHSSCACAASFHLTRTFHNSWVAWVLVSTPVVAVKPPLVWEALLAIHTRDLLQLLLLVTRPLWPLPPPPPPSPPPTNAPHPPLSCRAASGPPPRQPATDRSPLHPTTPETSLQGYTFKPPTFTSVSLAAVSPAASHSVWQPRN